MNDFETPTLVVRFESRRRLRRGDLRSADLRRAMDRPFTSVGAGMACRRGPSGRHRPTLLGVYDHRAADAADPSQPVGGLAIIRSDPDLVVGRGTGRTPRPDLHLLLLHPAHGRLASRGRFAGSASDHAAVGHPQLRPPAARPPRLAAISADLRPALCARPTRTSPLTAGRPTPL